MTSLIYSNPDWELVFHISIACDCTSLGERRKDADHLFTSAGPHRVKTLSQWFKAPPWTEIKSAVVPQRRESCLSLQACKLNCSLEISRLHQHRLLRALSPPSALDKWTWRTDRDTEGARLLPAVRKHHKSVKQEDNHPWLWRRRSGLWARAGL